MTYFPMLFLGEPHVVAYAIALTLGGLLGIFYVLFDLNKIIKIPSRKEFDQTKVSDYIGRHIAAVTVLPFLALTLYSRGTITWQTVNIIAVVSVVLAVAHCTYKIRFSPPDNKSLV